MTVMVLELYEALKAAGAPEDKAQAAARTVAHHDARFERIEHRLDRLEARIDALEVSIDARFAALEAKMDARFGAVDARFNALKAEMDARFQALEAQLSMLKWMNGIVIAGVVALIIKAFFP